MGTTGGCEQRNDGLKTEVMRGRNRVQGCEAGGPACVDDLLGHLLIWLLSPPGGLVFAAID